MKRRSLKPVPMLIAALVVGLVCLLELLPTFFPRFRTFQRLEWITYDWRMRHMARVQQPVSPYLGAVFIDDESIELVNQAYGYAWPWPRQLHGRMVRELAAQKAAAVGFDVLFTEVHGSSPDTDVLLPDGETVRSDEFFARQLQGAGNVFLAFAVSKADTATVEVQKGLFPNEHFLTNAAGLGHIVAESDDGVLRRALPFIDFGGRRIWQMGIVLAARQLQLDLANAVVKPDRIVLSGRNGTREIPLDENGFFYINWGLAWNDPRLLTLSSALLLNLDELRQNGQPGEYSGYLQQLREGGLKGVMGTRPFRDRLVVIGSIATGNNVSDVGATPVSSKSYLVSKHWNVANAILSGQFIVKSPLALNVALLLLLGALAATFTWEERVVTASLLVILTGVAYVVFCNFMFVYCNYWIPIVLPVGGGLLLTHLCLVTHRLIFEQTEQKRVKNVFTRIVSPNVVNELLKAERLALGGSRREITIYFADIRGFTEMTDSIQARAEEYVKEHNLSEAEAAAHFDNIARSTLETVNLYLATVADVIKKHSGTLDKYIGDCVMAFWGAPTPNERHALYAVRAAIDAQRAIYDLNQERFAENEKRKKENIARAAAGQRPLELLPLLTLGSGINTGWAIVGLMGSDAHILNYTVFGREVNLASRLEGVSGRGRIIIGEQTYAALLRDDPRLAATCVEQPSVTVKGIRQAVRIYEVPWKMADDEGAPAANAGGRDSRAVGKAG